MQIVAEESNVRIDKYISEKEKKLSRSYIQVLLDNENILVNSKKVKSSYKIVVGDIIEIKIPEKKELEVIAQDIPLDIIYEDDDIIVINKPKGMVVHPAHGNYDNTLVNAVLSHCKDSLSGINGVIRPGIVHRIDKDTSGILIIAKNDNAHNKLAEQFKEHTNNREYIALVRGIIKDNKGTIDMPLMRNKKERKKMAVDVKGKRAITHFEVIKKYGKEYTLVRLKLETGRTHQIRVHMAQIGHPLIGDTVYSNGKNEFNVKGQMLHACKLGIVHPKSNKYIEFETDIPTEFKKIIEDLNHKYEEEKM